MYSLLAWLRAFTIAFLVLAVHSREESLFTSSVTYCDPPETLLIQRFQVAYFPANTSVSFNVSVSSVQANVNVSANLFLNVYGLSPVNITLDLCTLLDGALCPLPLHNFTGSDSLTLPASIKVQDNLPGIAFKIPDLEGYAQLTLRDRTTNEIRACVQTTISNGWSAHQPAVEWTTRGIAIVGLVASLAHSAVSPDLVVPFRFLDLMHLYQVIATSALLNLNYPSVYRAFALNFGWAIGLVRSENSALQHSINSMRQRTGGHVSDADGGAAIDFVNRRLSPYNSPQTGLEAIANGLLTKRATVNLPQTSQGDVQTVTAASSNVLQAGLPIYVNELFIPTANAFMTVFIITLCLIAISGALFAIGYAIYQVVLRRRRTSSSVFDYASYAKSWAIRLFLVVSTPLLIFILYQWTLKDSWLSVLLSVITILLIFASILPLSLRIIRFARQETPSALYEYKFTQYNSYNPLYSQLRPARYWLFAIQIASIFFRAFFISIARFSSEAQIAFMLILELALVLACIVLRPYKTKGGDVFASYLALTRLVSMGLMVAFLVKLQVKPIVRVIIGFVVVVVFSVGVVVTILNLLGHIAKDTVWAIRKARWYRTRMGGSSSDSHLASERGSKGSMINEESRMAEKGIEKEKGASLPGSLDDSGESIQEIDLERSRPLNPTPDHQTPLDPSFLTPFPISPTGSTVTSMTDPPSIYTASSMSRRDSGSLTVGSLLPRRWSFTFSAPGSPGESSVGHQSAQQSRLTPSPMPSGGQSSDGGHVSVNSGKVSRNPSLRVYQHQHADIEEETSFSSSTRTMKPGIVDS